MTKLALCLFFLFCAVFGLDGTVTLNQQYSASIVPCQYLVYDLNIANPSVSSFLNLDFDTNSSNPIQVEVSNIPYATWGETSNITYTGSGTTFSIDILCDFSNVSTWYIAVTTNGVAPINFTILATQQELTVYELELGTSLTVSPDGRTNAFGLLTDFFHIKLSNTIKPGQIVNLEIASSDPIMDAYANINTLAAKFPANDNFCLIPSEFTQNDLVVDYCTLSTILNSDLYLTVVPSQNTTYTVTLTSPNPNITAITPTTTPWTVVNPTVYKLRTYAIDYYSFTVTNNTVQLLNITINNVQGGTVEFSYSVGQLPFVSCSGGSDCIANSIDCCTAVSTSCQLVIQPCHIQSTLTYYIGVKATSFTNMAVSPITYEISVSTTNFGTVQELSNTVFVSGSLAQAHYDQYLFDKNGFKIDDETTLSIHLYVDQSNSVIQNLNTSLFINFEEIAGASDEASCWTNYASCSINNVGSCTIQLNPCILNDYDDWYVSVYTGYSNNFYGREVSYTLVSQLSEPVQLQDPYLVINSVLYYNNFDHYQVSSKLLPSNGGFSLVVFNILGGDLNVYLNYGGLAGPLDTCPSCFNNTEMRVATQGSGSPLIFTVANCDSYVDDNSDAVYFSIYSNNTLPVSYSVTVEDIKNYKPSNSLKSGVPLVASIGPHSSLNYTISNSNSDSYLLVSLTQIDFINSPLTLTLHNATSLSCINSESIVGEPVTVTSVNQYASIVVPECDYTFGDGYIVIVENTSPNAINYNIFFDTPSSTPEGLGNNQAYSDSVVSNGREFFTYSPSGEDTLIVEVFFDACTDIYGKACNGTLYLTTEDPDSHTGCISEESIQWQASNNASCVYVQTSCSGSTEDIYMIVSTSSVLYPEFPLGFTITVSEFNSTVSTAVNRPLNMNIFPKQKIYHTFNYPGTTNTYSTIAVQLTNQQNGTVSPFVAQSAPPTSGNNCPCFDYISQQDSTFEYCNAQPGEWTALVEGSAPSNQLIGYTINVKQIDNALSVLDLNTPLDGSLIVGQYAFFNITAIDLSIPTIINVASTNGNVQVYTSTSSQPGTKQCGGSTLCPAGTSCSQPLSSCTTSGRFTFLSVYGATATSFNNIGFTISLSQIPPVILASNIESPVQIVQPNFFVEYTYKLPDTFVAPLVTFTTSNVTVSGSSSYSLTLYNSDSCFATPIVTRTCNSDCTFQVSSCILTEGSNLYLVIKAGNSALNYTISANFLDVAATNLEVTIDTPVTVTVLADTYTTFFIKNLAAGPQYALQYTIQSDVTSSATTYGNWDYATPGCTTFRNTLTAFSPVSQTVSSCCVQGGTYALAVIPSVDTNITVTFTKVQILSIAPYIPPATNGVVATYDLAPQQTQEFSVVFGNTDYYDILYIAVSTSEPSNIYFQHAGLAGPNSQGACISSIFSCVGQVDCLYLIPQCAFSDALVSPFVAGTVYIGVQNLNGTLPSSPLDITVTYKTQDYAVLADSAIGTPLTVAPLIPSYAIFPVAINSIDSSIFINVASDSAFTFNLYFSDCPGSAADYSVFCASSPCNYTVSTCSGIENILVEIINPANSQDNIQVSVSTSTTPSFPDAVVLTENSIPVTDSTQNYFSYEVTGGTTDYAELIINSYTGSINQLTINWAIAGIPVCFQQLTNAIWTTNEDGTNDVTLILNSCLLTTGKYYFEISSSVVSNYTIKFLASQQGTITQLTVPFSVSGQIYTYERVLYNLTIDANSVKVGQGLVFSIENKCGSSQFYINQGKFAGPECGDSGVISRSIDACELLSIPYESTGDNSLYLTVIGRSQSNTQDNIPAQFLLSVAVVGDATEFLPVGLDEVVSNSQLGNAIYVFSVSGVDSFVGEIQVAINSFEKGGANTLVVSLNAPPMCATDSGVSSFTLTNTGNQLSRFITSCQANEIRLIYISFTTTNPDATFQITHTRPFVRDLDEFDEQPQEGAVTPSLDVTTAFIDEEYYSISLNEKDIEHFLFTAWVTGDDDDDDNNSKEAGIQLTASQSSPPSLCSTGAQFHTAPLGEKISWEWCQVDLEDQLYLTVNYPLTTPDSELQTQPFPYNLYWSFGLDDDDIVPLSLGESACQLVTAGNTNYYSFDLQSDNQNIYSIEVYAINSDDDSCDSTLKVSIANGGLASVNCNLGSGFSQTCQGPCNGASSTCSFNFNCPIDVDASNGNFSVSVYAPGDSDVSYFIRYQQTPINAVELTLNEDAIVTGGLSSSPYYFTLTSPTLDPNEVLTISVTPVNGNSPTTVSYSVDYIPSSSCLDTTPCSATTGCDIIIDSCTSLGTTLIISVTSGAQFYISATTSEIPLTTLALNTYIEGSFAVGTLTSTVSYSITITPEDIADSLFGELAVLIYGINQASVNAWISYETVGNSANCALATKVITSSNAATKLSIDLCGFTNGTYYLTLQSNSVADPCSTLNYGVIASIGTSADTQNELVAGTEFTKPISIGSSTTDFFTFTTTSASIIVLDIQVPENLQYVLNFWESPYGNAVENAPGSTCLIPADATSGEFVRYWWGCDLVSSFAFVLTITSPQDLAVLPGASYSVLVQTLSYSTLSNTAISAQFSDYTYKFYQFTVDPTESFEIDISVTQGPNIFVQVYEGCSNDLLTYLDCYYGPCTIPLDWNTANFGNTTYTVVVTGAAPAKFTISLNVGEEQTCVSPTDTTLCEVKWNVWDYGTGETGFIQQNTASIVLYQDLVSKFCPPCECVELSSACNDSLIEFACTQTYRACDTTGLQASICQDSCEDIEENCGYTFEEVGLPQYSCNHNFYYTDTDGNDVCDDIYDIDVTSGDKLLWLIVLVVVALILIVLIAVGAFIFYKKYQQRKHATYESIHDADDSSSSSSINSNE